MTHVLAVDDEPDLLRALVLNLTNRGYQVSTAATGRDAIAQATRQPPDLLVLDLGLPDIDGLEVIRQLHSHQPDLPILVLSARTSSQDKVVALDLGAAPETVLLMAVHQHVVLDVVVDRDERAEGDDRRAPSAAMIRFQAARASGSRIETRLGGSGRESPGGHRSRSIPVENSSCTREEREQIDGSGSMS